jgi:hypothetical protein
MNGEKDLTIKSVKLVMLGLLTAVFVSVVKIEENPWVVVYLKYTISSTAKRGGEKVGNRKTKLRKEPYSENYESKERRKDRTDTMKEEYKGRTKMIIY